MPSSSNSRSGGLHDDKSTYMRKPRGRNKPPVWAEQGWRMALGPPWIQKQTPGGLRIWGTPGSMPEVPPDPRNPGPSQVAAPQWLPWQHTHTSNRWLLLAPTWAGDLSQFLSGGPGSRAQWLLPPIHSEASAVHLSGHPPLPQDQEP